MLKGKDGKSRSFPSIEAVRQYRRNHVELHCCDLQVLEDGRVVRTFGAT